MATPPSGKVPSAPYLAEHFTECAALAAILFLLTSLDCADDE